MFIQFNVGKIKWKIFDNFRILMIFLGTGWLVAVSVMILMKNNGTVIGFWSIRWLLLCVWMPVVGLRLFKDGLDKGEHPHYTLNVTFKHCEFERMIIIFEASLCRPHDYMR